MLSTIDPSGQRFLNSLGRMQALLDETQSHVASGRKLTAPSDAPDEVSTVLQLHAEIGRNEAIVTGLGTAKTEVDIGEQTLSECVDLVERASVIATQATGPMQTPATRATLSGAVQDLLDRLVTNSRAIVGGRYIFSGDADQAPSYQLNVSSPTGVDALQDPAATRRVPGPAGSTFPVALTAGQIFDARNPDGTPASTNVFAAVNSLRIALAGHDEDGIRTAIGSLQTAAQHLNNQLAFYGETQDRIASALSEAQKNDTRIRTELSGREDADLATEITVMQQTQTQIQAALQMRAQVPRTTLFDVLFR